MRTVKKVEIEPVFSELIPDRSLMEENKIYISREHNTASHLCLCGCKQLTITPLKVPEREQIRDWKLTDEKGKISLHPSILNPICKAHYIITKNIANFV